MKATITPAFLESIPDGIRTRLHLRPGMVLDFDESTPYLKAVPEGSAPSCDDEFEVWLSESIGLANGKFTTDELMRETRGED